MAYLLPLDPLKKENGYINSKKTLVLIFADCSLSQCTVVDVNTINSEKLSCTVPVSLAD